MTNHLPTRLSWRTAALAAYYYASLPRRWWNARVWRQNGQAPIAVLFYHRVADSEPNAWTLSNSAFARQIDWLTRHCDWISLAEAQARLQSRRNERPALCLTFDDGYADNCEFALPLVIERGIPCTYFVATHFMQTGEPFPHDAALGKPLKPNTPAQIKELAAAGIEIGAHTCTHADFSRVTDPVRIEREITLSKWDLEWLLGREVRYFAVPYGQRQQLAPFAMQVARDVGFAGVCSAYGGYNRMGDDPFHLQRVHGDAEMIRVRNAATLDPRWLDIRFDPPAAIPQACEVAAR